MRIWVGTCHKKFRPIKILQYFVVSVFFLTFAAIIVLMILNRKMEIDRETILLMSKGDKKAYETMFRRFYPKVHRFVAMLLKNKDDADDVCQLIFLKIWNKREKFTDIRDFDSYLFILTKYTVINYISSRHVMPIDIHSLPELCSNESSPFDDVVVKDTQLLVDMVVENMPQQRQMIYRMSREQHLKNEEIAQRLGVQKKTVENHLNLALKEIKKALYFVFLLTQLWG